MSFPHDYDRVKIPSKERGRSPGPMSSSQTSVDKPIGDILISEEGPLEAACPGVKAGAKVGAEDEAARAEAGSEQRAVGRASC